MVRLLALMSGLWLVLLLELRLVLPLGVRSLELLELWSVLLLELRLVQLQLAALWEIQLD